MHPDCMGSLLASDWRSWQGFLASSRYAEGVIAAALGPISMAPAEHLLRWAFWKYIGAGELIPV